MIITTKNNRQIFLQAISEADFVDVCTYFGRLSEETKHRYGPHSFDLQTLMDMYNRSGNYQGYIARSLETGEVIAYAVLKRGFLEHDRQRLRSYGFEPDAETDCTYAPSVADSWQSCGVGGELFRFILSELKISNIQRIILWGGVQADNEKAVNFYLKFGFRTLGEFEYLGWNKDMVLEIH